MRQVRDDHGGKIKKCLGVVAAKYSFVAVYALLMCSTGAHLSLSSKLIAQHGKSAHRDRLVHGSGNKRAFIHQPFSTDETPVIHGPHSGTTGSWDYDNDNAVFASCEDNADAEVGDLTRINNHSLGTIQSS